MSKRDSTAFSTLVSSAKRSGLENLMEGVRSLMKMRKKHAILEKCALRLRDTDGRRTHSQGVFCE